MEQFFKKIVIVLAIFGLVGFLGNLVIDNPYTHRLIRAGINEKVKELTYLTLDFKAVKVSLLPLGLDLYGFYLAPAATANKPLTRASHLEVRVSLFSIFMGEPSLSLVEASDLEVIWPPPWDFPGFLKNPGKGSTKPLKWPPEGRLPIQEVVIRNAQIYLEIPNQEQIPLAPSATVLTTIGLNVSAEIGGWDNIEAEIDAAAINAALGPASILEDTSLTARLELKKNQITANHLSLNGQRIKLDGDLIGKFKVDNRQKIFDSVDLKASAEVDGDLSILGSFLDISDTRGPVKGHVGVKAFIPVESQAPATFMVEGKGKAHGALLYGFKLHNSEVDFKITEDDIVFTNINVIIGEQLVGKGQGEIAFNEATDFKFSVAPDHLQLTALLEALGVDFSVFDTAITSPDLILSGMATPFVLNIKASGLFTDITLPEIEYDHSNFPESPSCRLAFKLSVATDFLDFGGTEGICYQAPRGAKEIMKANQITAPGNSNAVSSVALAGQIFFEDKKGLDLTVKSPAIDIQMAQYFSQVSLRGQGEAGTRIHGPFSHVLVDVEAALKQVLIHDIPLGTVAAKVTVDGDQLLWRDVTATPDPLAGGQIKALEGSLAIGPELIIDTRLTAKDITEETVEKIFAAIIKDNKISFGVKDISLDIKGPLLFPLAATGRVAVDVNQISFDHEILADTFTAKLNASPKGWSSDNLKVKLGDLLVQAKFVHKRAFPFNYQEAETTDEIWTSLGLHPDDSIVFEFESGDSGFIDTGKKEIVGPERPGTPKPDHLQRLPYVGQIFREINIKGLVEISGKLEGNTEKLQGVFSGRLNKPQVFGSGLSPVNVKGFVDGGKLDLMIDHSGNSFQGRLSTNFLAKGVPYDWFFNFNRMDLRAFGTQFFYSDARNYAYLTADWQMRGNFTDWWRSTGELNIKDLRANYVQDVAGINRSLQIKQEQPAKLVFGKDRWYFEDDKDLFLTSRNVRLRLSVNGTKPPEKIDIKLESILDVALIKDFISGVDTASGKIRVDAEIKGAASSPQLSFEISDLKQNPFIAATWKPVTVGLTDIRPPFRNIQMRVVYRDQRLVIDTLTADKGAGTVKASGSLNLDPEANEESRLDIDLKDATMIYPVAFLKNFETQISGNVSVSGKGIPFRISGDLNIMKARSTEEVDIRNEIIDALRRQSFTTSLVSDRPVVTLDLNIEADRTINIHNRNLQAVLSANLQIKGNDITPSVSGQVEVDKGKFIYKREFQVTRGLVTFDDPVKPDPSLDILAVSEVGNYRVYIAVNGRASNPTVELTTDPPNREDGSPISKSEILVLISSGKLPDTNRSIGEAQNAATSEAINLIMGQFEEPLEKLFDLTGQNVVRTVYIDTYPSQSEGSDQGKPIPRVNLPIDLSENFDIVLRADQSTNEISTEYNIHDNITFSSSVKKSNEDSKGVTAERTSRMPVEDAQLDLKFRFSFE